MTPLSNTGTGNDTVQALEDFGTGIDYQNPLLIGVTVLQLATDGIIRSRSARAEWLHDSVLGVIHFASAIGPNALINILYR